MRAPSTKRELPNPDGPVPGGRAQGHRLCAGPPKRGRGREPRAGPPRAKATEPRAQRSPCPGAEARRKASEPGRRDLPAQPRRWREPSLRLTGSRCPRRVPSLREWLRAAPVALSRALPAAHPGLCSVRTARGAARGKGSLVGKGFQVFKGRALSLYFPGGWQAGARGLSVATDPH